MNTEKWTWKNLNLPSPRNKVFRWPVIISWTSAQHLSENIKIPDSHKELDVFLKKDVVKFAIYFLQM